LRFHKKYLVGLVIIALVAAATIYVWAEEREKSKREVTYQDLERFAEVFEKIMDNYVEEVGSTKIIDAAIEAMLEQLDPHSLYMDKHDYENLMIGTQGEFGGLGITISIRDDFPTVISPIEETPAYRLGIQGGDRIVEIEGASTEGWSSEKAVSKLRGEPGSQVNITISREGLEDSLHYSITREIIKVPSITYSDIIGDRVAYVRIARFSTKTAEELDDILNDYEADGLKGLILDLRSNPGGLLKSAYDVSDLFLEKDRLIVYTESRDPEQNMRYKSRLRNIHDGYPIVLLVNEATASASEIVSGALQDWDKALIVGQPTFGKGSVQTVFNLQGNSALKLTTQRYFTPVGRSIHKGHFFKEETEDKGETAENVELEEYKTYNGRKVYGGGGIRPDWEIELPEFTEFERKVEQAGVFFSFAIHYTAYHDVDEDFEVGPEILSEFRDFAKTNGAEIKDEEWNEDNIDYVKLAIKREVFRKLYGTRGAYIATMPDDEVVNKVLDMLGRTGGLSEMFDYVERQKDLVKAEE